MSKKINTPAPVVLYFSATIKTTELILELGRWKSAYQLLHTNFLSLTLTAQDAILHLAKYLSLIMQIAPLVSIIQNVCRISPNKMYLFACIWSYFSLEQLSAVYQRGVGKNFVSNANFITIVERTYQGEGFISRYTYMAAGCIHTVWIGNA